MCQLVETTMLPHQREQKVGSWKKKQAELIKRQGALRWLSSVCRRCRPQSSTISTHKIKKKPTTTTTKKAQGEHCTLLLLSSQGHVSFVCCFFLASFQGNSTFIQLKINKKIKKKKKFYKKKKKKKKKKQSRESFVASV